MMSRINKYFITIIISIIFIETLFGIVPSNALAKSEGCAKILTGIQQVTNTSYYILTDTNKCEIPFYDGVYYELVVDGSISVLGKSSKPLANDNNLDDFQTCTKVQVDLSEGNHIWSLLAHDPNEKWGLIGLIPGWLHEYVYNDNNTREIEKFYITTEKFPFADILHNKGSAQFIVSLLGGYKYEISSPSNKVSVTVPEAFKSCSGSPTGGGGFGGSTSLTMTYRYNLIDFIELGSKKGTVPITVRIEQRNVSDSKDWADIQVGLTKTKNIDYDFSNGICRVYQSGSQCLLDSVRSDCESGYYPCYSSTDCSAGCTCIPKGSNCDAHIKADDNTENNAKHTFFKDFSLPPIKALTWNTAQDWIHNLYIMIIGFGIISAIFIIPYVSILFATGNPERIKTGKEWLTSLVTGLILLTLSAVIIKIVGSALGF